MGYPDNDVVEPVVFDLDGVLVDSEPVWEHIRRGLVEEHGGSWTSEVQSRLMGMSTAGWADYLSRLVLGLTPQQTARVVIDRMRNSYAERVPYLPGALDALARIGAHRPLGLASASPRELIDSLLRRPELAGRFAVTVSADEVGHGKPEPDVYLAVTEKLAVPPSACVAVEDSSNGVLAAAAAGLAVVAVPQHRYPLAPNARAHAALVLASLDELTVDVIAQTARHDPAGGRPE
jgi:HAD superfamily hydrolase (TIGR01509 family)